MEVLFMNEIIQAISSVGFPIVCSVLLGYLLLTEQKNHKEEMNQLKDAINSNTMIMVELKTLIESIRNGE